MIAKVKKNTKKQIFLLYAKLNIKLILNSLEYQYDKIKYTVCQVLFLTLMGKHLGCKKL
jgi:hypothetical protein